MSRRTPPAWPWLKYPQPHAPAPPADTTPPAAISDLTAEPGSVGTYDAILFYTTPGDDGMIGTAAFFDVRYSATGAISTEAAWDAATSDLGGWVSQGTLGGSAARHDQLYNPPTIPGTYFFSIRFRDEAGNVGGLSNSPSLPLPNP